MSAVISNSELQTAKKCKRKWWISYYLQIHPSSEKAGGALQLGSNVHAALAAMYGEGQHPVTVFDEIYTAERKRYTDMEYPPDLTEFEQDHHLGRIMLEGYIEWLQETGVDSDYEVTGAEQQISVPLFEGEVTFKGKLDLRMRRRSDGRRGFLDSKTTGSFSKSAKECQVSEQMLGYQLLERLLDPEDAWVESGFYNLLKKVKRTERATPPFYDRIEAYHNDVELRNYWKRLHGTITDIMRMRARLDAGEDPMFVCYPTPTRDCSWSCAHYAACPLFDDGSNIAGLLESAYEKVDPYARYIDPAHVV